MVRPKRKGTKHVAVYVRVSSKQQQHASQLPDLERWAEGQDEDVQWYKDTVSGKTMDRDAWRRLDDAMRAGKVSTVVVWRLDRLGRTASGLTALFEELQRRNINLVSIKDAIDLSTAAGRLMANVLASVAAYETEVRGERVRAGQAAAKARGKRWGGSKKGKRRKVTRSHVRAIRRMKDDGEPVAAIARTLGLSRPTVYTVLADL